MAVSLLLMDEAAVHGQTKEKITCSCCVTITTAEALMVDLWKDMSVPMPKEVMQSALRESALQSHSHMGKSWEEWGGCTGILRCNLCLYRSMTQDPLTKVVRTN